MSQDTCYSFHSNYFTFQSRFLYRLLQIWRVIYSPAARYLLLVNRNKNYFCPLSPLDPLVWRLYVNFMCIFVYRGLLVLAGRNKRVDRQNVHMNVLLTKGRFMIRGMFTSKKWHVLVSIGNGRLSRNGVGYCSNLCSCTDSNRNILPARKNQDTFVIVLDQSRVGLI